MTGRPDITAVLEAFRTPTRVTTAAGRFGWSVTAVQGLLRQLQARGLVVPAEPGKGACSSGCGVCSMQSFCPRSATAEGEETSPVANNPPFWRLTPLGEHSVRPQRHSAS